jgi:hypothetical protein
MDIHYGVEWFEKVPYFGVLGMAGFTLNPPSV